MFFFFFIVNSVLFCWSDSDATEAFSVSISHTHTHFGCRLHEQVTADGLLIRPSGCGSSLCCWVHKFPVLALFWKDSREETVCVRERQTETEEQED